MSEQFENASSQLIDLQSKRASPEMKEHLRELKGPRDRIRRLA